MLPLLVLDFGARIPVEQLLTPLQVAPLPFVHGLPVSPLRTPVKILLTIGTPPVSIGPEQRIAFDIVTIVIVVVVAAYIPPSPRPSPLGPPTSSPFRLTLPHVLRTPRLITLGTLKLPPKLRPTPLLNDTSKFLPLVYTPHSRSNPRPI